MIVDICNSRMPMEKWEAETEEYQGDHWPVSLAYAMTIRRQLYQKVEQETQNDDWSLVSTCKLSHT